jgi:hypothetical protein
MVLRTVRYHESPESWPSSDSILYAMIGLEGRSGSDEVVKRGWAIDRDGAFREAPIVPPLNDPSFVRDKLHWGSLFRLGSLKIPPHNFRQIAKAMGRNFEEDFRA